MKFIGGAQVICGRPAVQFVICVYGTGFALCDRCRVPTLLGPCESVSEEEYIVLSVLEE